MPSTIITDTCEEKFKDTNDLSSYDIRCDDPKSRIPIEWGTPDILERFKSLTENTNMTCDWMAKHLWSWSTGSNIYEVLSDGCTWSQQKPMIEEVTKTKLNDGV